MWREEGLEMNERSLVQKAYTSVLEHYVELAEVLGVQIDEARVLVRDTAAA